MLFPIPEKDLPETIGQSGSDSDAGLAGQQHLGAVAPDLTIETALAAANRERAPHIKTTPANVEAAYAEQLEAGTVTEEQIGLIINLLIVGKGMRVNLSGLADELGVDNATITRLFSGKYGAKLDRMLEKIRVYLKSWNSRAELGVNNFVQTSIVTTCWEACKLARAHGIPIPVYGESQLGKTWAWQEYQRQNNHGSTIYVRMPAAGHYGKFLRRLGQALGQNTERNSSSMADTLIKCLNPTKLLIVDELHQCVLSGDKGGVRIQTIEYLRELYDMSGCGMILCGTHIAREAMERGKNMDLLEQFRRRGIPPIQLPPVLPNADLDAIAAGHGLPPAPSRMLINREAFDVTKWRRDLILSTGLKAYVMFMNMGGTLAQKRHDEPGWDYVLSAHDILQKLSEPDARKGGK